VSDVIATRWRVLALLIWMAVAAAYLSFYVLDLRLDYYQPLIPCLGPDCNYLALPPSAVQALGAASLSTSVYAAYVLGVSSLTVGVYWVLGLLILWRSSRQVIELAVSLALIVMPISMIADADNVAAWWPALRLPVLTLSIFGGMWLYLFLYLFPNGRFVPRWAAAGFVIGTLVDSIQTLRYTGGLPTIVPYQARAVLDALFLILLLFALGFQIYRYARISSQTERQQTKWVLLGLAGLMAAIPLWFLFFDSDLFASGLPRLLASVGGWTLLMTLTLLLPVTLTIAILRYRLWDIDLLIRRTLVYGLLSVLLALVYFGSVVLLQRVATLVTGQASAVSIVISTLAIAALFNPLRARIQVLIDRRFYRRKYDAQQTLAAFAATTRDEVALDGLVAELGRVVQETMQPAHVSLWLAQIPVKGRAED
jgi:hypothetical protein